MRRNAVSMFKKNTAEFRISVLGWKSGEICHVWSAWSLRKVCSKQPGCVGWKKSAELSTRSCALSQMKSTHQSFGKHVGTYCSRSLEEYFFTSWSSTGPAPAPGGPAASLRPEQELRARAVHIPKSPGEPCAFPVRTLGASYPLIAFALFKETRVRRSRESTCFWGGGEAPSSADNPGLLREERAGGQPAREWGASTPK